MTTMETEATSAERAALARDYETLGERLARRGIAIDRIKERAAAFGVAVPSGKPAPAAPASRASPGRASRGASSTSSTTAPSSTA